MSKAEEKGIALALNAASVVSLSESTSDITSIARKWRSAFVKLGFLWPDVSMRPKVLKIAQSEFGTPFTLTPNGCSLLSVKSLQGEQEILLRSIAALRLPSPLEPGYDFPQFSPFKHMIRILDELQRIGCEPYISRLEMASIVILANGQEQPNSIASQIALQRIQRMDSAAKRGFDSQAIRSVAESRSLKYSTLYDYQDVTFRYFKATGIFQSRGRGIALVPERRKIANLLANSPDLQLTAAEYIKLIAKGAMLPTDTQEGATEVLSDLLTIASEWPISFDLTAYNLATPEKISLARHDLEELIFQKKELQYAANQTSQIEEILAYLQMLDENRSNLNFKGKQLTIPREERPAYFEWLL